MVRVEDELIIDDDPGALPGDARTFYRNADRTRRDGLELGGRWWPETLPGLQLSAAYTWMDARFDNAEARHLPGLPQQFGLVDAQLDLHRGYFIGLDVQYLGRRYADDANTVAVPAQSLSNLRLGREFRHGQLQGRWAWGIENLFNQQHLGNLRINDRNQRYYEPGAARRFYFSVGLMLG